MCKSIVNKKLFAGSLIYRLKGIDPDGDVLSFGVREQPGSDVIRVENFGNYEANIYLNKLLDREVISKIYSLSVIIGIYQPTWKSYVSCHNRRLHVFLRSIKIFILELSFIGARIKLNLLTITHFNDDRELQSLS